MALLSFFFSYILGSFNFAIFISKKFYNKNIKQLGSKNAGMTNVLRNFGFIPAVITFLGDVLKGFISLLVCYILCFKLLNSDVLMYVQYMACISALLGHIFPIFYKFKGGKGYACYTGMLLAINYKLALIMMAYGAITTLVTNYIALATISTSYIVLIYYIYIKAPIGVIIILLILAIVITYKHLINIRRIIRKEEIGLRKKK